MSALSELATSITGAQSDVEDAARKALVRLSTAKAGAIAVVTKVDGISAEIEQSTKDLENFTNQLTNGGPA